MIGAAGAEAEAAAAMRALGPGLGLAVGGDATEAAAEAREGGRATAAEEDRELLVTDTLHPNP